MVDMASLHAVVYGRVQGVFFRSYVEKVATRLNLTGYVRNQPGGTVEVIAEGERQNLEKLVGYLNIGPPAAKVNKVLAAWQEYTGGFRDFRIRY